MTKEDFLKLHLCKTCINSLREEYQGLHFDICKWKNTSMELSDEQRCKIIVPFMIIYPTQFLGKLFYIE